MLDERTIKTLIAEYQRFATQVQFMPRDIQVDMTKCNVFVGVRRCGKSYLMYQCIRHLLDAGTSPESILFMNFEDDRLPPLDLSDLDRIKTAYEEMYDHRPIFFLDEVQNVDGWEKFARRLADTGYQVFLTGSNAKMLSMEMAGRLGGRYALTEVYPYSFAEYLAARGVRIPTGWRYLQNSDLKREFADYFKFGGLPEAVATDRNFKRQWLSSLFDKIYLGDIVARNGIRKPQALKMLVRKIIDSVGQPVTASRISSIVSAADEKLKPETATEYMGYCGEAWLTFSLEDYAGKLTEKMSVKKHYLIDNGLITLFRDNADSLLLENLVAVTLRKRHGDRLFYYRHNIEIDFYLPDTREAIQVSHDVSGESTLDHELNAIESLNRHLGIERATLVTYSDERAVTLPSGLEVCIVPVWKWLLEI